MLIDALEIYNWGILTILILWLVHKGIEIWK